MRIAFLSKRRYMGKDLIADRFGRFYELPRQLALLGHVVRGYCLDYHRMGAGRWEHPIDPGELVWQSRSLGRLPPLGLSRYLIWLHQQLREFRPDVLVGASDIPQLVLTHRLASMLGLPFALDLYDDFEGYGQAYIPGFVSALKAATRAADLLTVVSEPLKQKMEARYRVHAPVRVLPNAVDKAVFVPGSRVAARRRLQLPESARLIGTAGGLSRKKGVATLYSAWPEIASACPDAHLVVAGSIDRHLSVPPGPRVHHLGPLPHAEVAELFRALDVGVVTVLDSTFGRHCFPQKAYEMIACGLPLVAADIGVMSDLLADLPRARFAPRDHRALAQAVIHQLNCPTRLTPSMPDWKQLAVQLASDLSGLSSSEARGRIHRS